MNRIEKGSLLVLAIIVAFNIFFGLGSIPLLDPDEPVCAVCGRAGSPAAGSGGQRRHGRAGRADKGGRALLQSGI